jgi:hypothetical protein
MTRARRVAYLILLGVGTLTLSLIVLTQNQSISTELLGTVGLLGGLAIILVTLPTNGKDHGSE